MDERTFIRELLRPLCGQGSFDLIDDAALAMPNAALMLPNGGSAGFVVSTDLLVEGVHFLPDDPPEGLAGKALRCNLSDIAAMGATPTAALFSLVSPSHWDEAFLRALVGGLGQELERFGVALLGGDTSSASVEGAGCIQGVIEEKGVLSFVVWGEVSGSAVLRSGAQAGETLWVSGTIGDATLGLDALCGGSLTDGLNEAQWEAVVGRYRCPEPRLGLGAGLAHHATAMMDVSDGLLIDADRLAEASGVSLEIEAASIPLSEAGRAVVEGSGESQEVASQEVLLALLGGGDDYELLFTTPSRCEEQVRRLAQASRTAVAPIGKVRARGSESGNGG